ncbi:MAG: hypothetical protein ACSLEN_03440 [Candidatus Malihini olakiniferum]
MLNKAIFLVKKIILTNGEGNVNIDSDNLLRYYTLEGSRQFGTLNTTGIYRSRQEKISS